MSNQNASVQRHPFMSNPYAPPTCKSCGAGQRAKQHQGQPTRSGHYCDECQGYTHMPWCSEYDEPIAHPLSDPYTCFDDNGGQCQLCLEAIISKSEGAQRRLSHTRAIVDHAEMCKQRVNDDEAFRRAWERAPRTCTATVDKIDASYWYRTGRADEREVQVQIRNDDLRVIQQMRERMD